MTMASFQKVRLGDYAPALCYLVGDSELQQIYNDFTEGGNDMVYCAAVAAESNLKADFMQPNEIFTQGDFDDFKYHLLHELHERNLMHNEGWVYDDAHDDANFIEHQIARVAQREGNLTLVDELIQNELNIFQEIVEVGSIGDLIGGQTDDKV